MRTTLLDVGVGLLIALAVALAVGDGPAYFLMGLALALSLSVMLYFGSYAGPRSPSLSPTRYAVAGAAAVLVGYLCYRLMDQQPSWWSVGFILVGVTFGAVPAFSHQRAGRPQPDPHR